VLYAAAPWQKLSSIVRVSRLARHLDLSTTRIGQLVAEKIIVRLPSGKFDQDACRIAYLRWLRAPERRAARSQVDQDFTSAKAELIRLRVGEKGVDPARICARGRRQGDCNRIDGDGRHGGAHWWLRFATAAPRR
jgi:hypothetical protein